MGRADSGRRWLTVVALTSASVLVSAAYLDRPVADFAQAHVYGTLVFGAASGFLGSLRAILLVLVIGFLACAGWVLGGRKLAPWGTVVWACSTVAVIAVAIAVALKFLIGRSDVYPAYLTRGIYEVRPLHWSGDYGAFPSASATVTAAVAAVLWTHLPRWRALWVTFVIVLAVALLAANGHWLSDVLAGVALGVFIGTRVVKLPAQGASVQESGGAKRPD